MTWVIFLRDCGPFFIKDLLIKLMGQLSKHVLNLHGLRNLERKQKVRELRVNNIPTVRAHGRVPVQA